MVYWYFIFIYLSIIEKLKKNYNPILSIIDQHCCSTRIVWVFYIGIGHWSKECRDKEKNNFFGHISELSNAYHRHTHVRHYNTPNNKCVRASKLISVTILESPMVKKKVLESPIKLGEQQINALDRICV
jgi:hypothetical protein